MKKMFFLLVSIIVFSESSISLQTVLKVGSEIRLSQSSRNASKWVHLPNDQVPLSGVNKKIQVFTPPTNDRIAKYILTDDESVRVDMLRVFTGINSLSSATQLDDHLKEYNSFNMLRDLKKLNFPSSQGLFEAITASSEIELSIDGKKNKEASEVLKEQSFLYVDFFKNMYCSTAGFLCETDFGLITVNFQVAQQDYWDKKTLASICEKQSIPITYYGQIQQVIDINLLVNGSTPYWKDGDFMRDYSFINKRASKYKIPDLRLIQYSLGDVDFNHPDLKENNRLRQWIEFFKSAHEKESVPPFIDNSVRKAYEMIRLDTLKIKHPEMFFCGRIE